MPNPVIGTQYSDIAPSALRTLDWSEIEKLRQARFLLTTRTKWTREDYYLEQQQLVDVKLWLEEHMEDYPQWVIHPGSGFTRQFSRDATAEEIAEAEAVVLELAPFETVRRSTTFGDRLDAMAAAPITRNIEETIRWRTPQPFAAHPALDERPSNQPLTTAEATVALRDNNTIPSGGFWWVDELTEVNTYTMVVGHTPTMLMYDVETQSVPNVHT